MDPRGTRDFAPGAIAGRLPSLMALATLNNLEKTFGKRVMFDHLNLTIYEGERIGLIGDNGSGKTTLFRMLAGEMSPDVGSVSISRGVKIGWLQQDPTFDPTNTVMDEAELAFAKLHALSHRLHELEHLMADHAGEELQATLDDYQHVQHDFELEGGFAWRHKLEATLLGVGLTESHWEQKVDTLSGGQRSRLALAKLLISSPDLLLLDEPTNHLDLSAIEWLQNYLLNFSGAVLLVSHDRYLLDKLATRIAWLTRRQISSYKGNYSNFVEQKALQELTQQRHYQEQQADIEKQKEFIRRFGAGQRSKEAKGREKRLNRLLASDQMIAGVQQSKKINLSLETDQRAGDQVLDVRELTKAYDEKLLWKEIKFHIVRGERIGVIGPNGSGKTTLLEVLLGRRDADAGKLKWGANLQIGYYDQRLDDLNPENTVIEELNEGRDLPDQVLKDTLGLFLFRGDDVFKPVSLLSGGERARIRLAQLLIDQPNVLILDEPTNHLDVGSCEALENALRDFPGTLIFVSHDRYFIDRVAKRLLILDPPGLKDFEGNYSAWQAKQKTLSAKPTASPAHAPRSKPAPGAKVQAKPTKDNPYKRPFGRLPIGELEKEIQVTERKLAECQNKFGEAKIFRDPAAKKRLQDDFDALKRKIDDLEAEYFAREQ